MVKVCIIENNSFQKNKLTSYISDIINENNLEMEVEYSTSDVKEFMYNIEWDDSERVYFIDIDLGGYINGIDFAVFIRKYDLEGYIVFLNSFGDLNQLMIEYNIKALAVVEKNSESEFETGVKDCLLKIESISNRKKLSKENIYSLQDTYRELNLEKDKIMFIKASKNEDKIIIHGVNRQIEVCANLKAIADTIGKNFNLINKSLLINSNNVKEINYSNASIIMSNGENIFISGIKASKFAKTVENLK